jgi:hypothetical protein
LRDKVRDYGTTLLETKKMDARLTELTKELFNVESERELLPNGEVADLTWEQREFANKQLIFVLGALSQIQSNIRIVELEYLASVK